MGEWRYFAETLNGDGTADLLASDLPLQDVSITQAVSAPDSISFSVKPRDERLIGPDGQSLLKSWQSAVYAEESGNIRAGGIYVHEENEPDGTLACEAVGFGGYPAGQPYTESWSGVEVDPLDVVRQIWNHLQSQPMGNLGVTLDQLKTGLKIGVEMAQGEFDTESGPLVYESGPIYLADYLNQDLGDEIDKLAKSAPFDWRERHAYADDDTIDHFIDFGYPKIGRRIEDGRFVIGENIFAIPVVTVDGDDYADTVLALGAGEGRTMIRAVARNNTGRLRRVKSVTDKTQRTAVGIRSVAQNELQWRSLMDGDVTEVALVDHPNAPVGMISPGDEIYLQGKLDWQTIEMWCRVTSITIRPSDMSVQTMSITRSDRISS